MVSITGTTSMDSPGNTGQYMPIMSSTGQYMVVKGNTGQYWAIIINNGQLWAILGTYGLLKLWPILRQIAVLALGVKPPSARYIEHWYSCDVIHGDVDEDVDEDGDVDEVVGCSKYLIPASLPHRSVVRPDKLMINSNIKVSCELLSFWSYFSIDYKSQLIE